MGESSNPPVDEQPTLPATVVQAYATFPESQTALLRDLGATLPATITKLRGQLADLQARLPELPELPSSPLERPARRAAVPGGPERPRSGRASSPAGRPGYQRP